MPSLAELQRSFAEAIFAPDGDAPAFALDRTENGADRFAIYRRAIFANYRNALGATYPVVQRLVGAAVFRAAVDAYVRAQPSTCGDLNDYGDTFAAFLATYPPAAGLPHLSDVARLEWAIDGASRAADANGTPDEVLAALAAVPAERLPDARLRLAPSCRLLTSVWPVFRIWQVNQPDHAGDDHVRLDPAGEALLVRRDAAGVAVLRLAAGDFAWLATLAGGATLAAAIDAATRADAAFDLGRALHAHVAGGTIAGIATG
jgi:hypothetical protein